MSDLVSAEVQAVVSWLSDAGFPELDARLGTSQPWALRDGTEVKLRPAGQDVPVLSCAASWERQPDGRTETFLRTVTVPDVLPGGPPCPSSTGLLLARLTRPRDDLTPVVTTTAGQVGWLAVLTTAPGTVDVTLAMLGADRYTPDWVEALLPAAVTASRWDLPAANAHLVGPAPVTFSAEDRVLLAAHMIDGREFADRCEDWLEASAADRWLLPLRARQPDEARQYTGDDDRHRRWIQTLLEATNRVQAHTAPRVVVVPRFSYRLPMLHEMLHPYRRARKSSANLFVAPPLVAAAACHLHPERGWGRSRRDAHVDAFDLGPAHECDTDEVYRHALDRCGDLDELDTECSPWLVVPGIGAAYLALTEARVAVGCTFGQSDYTPPVPMRRMGRTGEFLAERLPDIGGRRRTTGCTVRLWRDRRGRLHGIKSCPAQGSRPVAPVLVEIDSTIGATLCRRCDWLVPEAHPVVELIERMLEVEEAVLFARSAATREGAEYVGFDEAFRTRHRALVRSQALDECLSAQRAISELCDRWPALRAGYRAQVKQLARKAKGLLTALRDESTRSDVPLAAAACLLGREDRPVTEPAALTEGIRISPRVDRARVDAAASAEWNTWVRYAQAGLADQVPTWSVRGLFGRARAGYAEVEQRLQSWRTQWDAAAQVRATEVSDFGDRLVILELPGPQHQRPRREDRPRRSTPGFGVSHAELLAHFTVTRSARAALVEVPFVIAEAIATADFWPLGAAVVTVDAAWTERSRGAGGVDEEAAVALVKEWRPGTWPPALLRPREDTPGPAGTRAPLDRPWRSARRTRVHSEPVDVDPPEPVLKLGATADLAGLPWPDGSVVRVYAGERGLDGTLHGNPRCARFNAAVVTDVPVSMLPELWLCPRCLFAVPAELTEQMARSAAEDRLLELVEQAVTRLTNLDASPSALLKALRAEDGLHAQLARYVSTDRALGQAAAALDAAIVGARQALADRFADDPDASWWSGPIDAPRLVAVADPRTDAYLDSKPGAETGTADRVVAWELIWVLRRVAGPLEGPLVVRVPPGAARWLCTGERPFGEDLGPAGAAVDSTDVLADFVTRWQADGGWAIRRLAEAVASTQQPGPRRAATPVESASGPQTQGAPGSPTRDVMGNVPFIAFDELVPLSQRLGPGPSPSARDRQPARGLEPGGRAARAKALARLAGAASGTSPEPPRAAGQRPRCSEKRTNGQPCRGWPTLGTAMCAYHLELSQQQSS